MSSGRRSVGSPEGGGKSSVKEKGKRKLPELEVVGGKLSACGQLHVIMNTVRARLSDKNLEAFRRTCFGHLLDVPRIQPQMQLIFLMLNSLIEESEHRNVMSFRINDRIFELGRQEFFCISGLSFAETVRLPSSSQIHGHIFGGKQNLKCADIDEAFKNYTKSHKGSGSLVLKLALLYVLYGLLINRDQVWKKIEVEYMHLVDDLSAFNKYPWGRVAYDHLVHWTHRARSTIVRHTVDSDRPSTDVCGFYLTLQIFAFEIMPMLAKHCAKRIDSVAFPRMCRWTTDAYFKYIILLRYFQSYDVGGMMHFEFSHDERGRLRAAGLSDEDALQRGSEGDARQPQSYNNLKLVDEDDDNQEDAIKPNFDDGMEDVSKANADDELEEVRLRKASHSSASRRMRRENASKIGNLLRAATVSSSSCRGPEETKSEQSLAQLAKTILEMNMRMQNDSSCMQKMEQTIMGMNVMLKSVVDRISGVEELVHGLKRRLDGFRSVDDEATDGVDKEDPPEVAMESGQPSEDFVEGRSAEKHVGDAGGVDSVDKGFTNQSFNAVSYPERQGGEAGVMDCVDIPLNNESIVKVESGVERQDRDVGNTEIIDGVGNVESFEGVGHAERQGADCMPSQKVLDLLEQVFADEVIYSHTQVYEGGAAENAEMEMTEAQSPEYEIFDLEAYEPDCSPQKMDQENPPAKKRLFEEVSGSVEPCYGTICGEPLPKKRKTKGKNVAENKPVKLSSLQWETFDPHREYDWPTERDFHHWYSHAKGENSDLAIQLPTECKSEAPFSWFVHLYTAKGWLTDEHCDVLMNLLIIYSQKFPAQFLHNWTVIESIGSQTLALDSMADVPERIMPYVEGEFPQQGAKPWHKVDVVYGVGHVGKDHWVLYRLDLAEQRVVVFDSMSATKALWDDIKAAFANVCKNVPLMIELLDVYREKRPKPRIKKVWDLVRYEHPPQQCNMSDCRVLCMKSLECLVTGKPLSAIDPMRCSAYRRAYCVELFVKSQTVARAGV